MGTRSRLKLVRFLRDRAGATAIEYGVMAALIAGGGMAVWQMGGDAILAEFQSLSGRLEAATGADGNIPVGGEGEKARSGQ